MMRNLVAASHVVPSHAMGAMSSEAMPPARVVADAALLQHHHPSRPPPTIAPIRVAAVLMVSAIDEVEEDQMAETHGQETIATPSRAEEPITMHGCKEQVV